MELLKKYFPELRDADLFLFQQFKEEFLKWNEQINCVSRKDVENFDERHILHSLAISKVISFPKGSRVLDVGTGGGFPGLPLAIMFPNTEFHLIDGIGKKIKVVNGVVEALNLKNVKATQCRSEEIKGQYDYVTARAVARASSFNHWVKHLIKRNVVFEGGGIYYLKGGDVLEEMKELKLPYKIWELKEFYSEEFFDTKKVVKF